MISRTKNRNSQPTQRILSWAVVACACVFAAIAAPVYADNVQLAAADFANTARIRMPRLSPDGKHMAVTRRVMLDGIDIPMIYIYRLSDFSVVAQVRLPKFRVPVAYSWVSNSRLIVSTGREFGSLEIPVWTGEVVAMDLDGRNQEYLFGHNMFLSSRRGALTDDDYGFGYVDGIAEGRDGRFFLSEHQWDNTSKRTMLYAINARNAVRKLIAEVGIPQAHFLVQRNGTPRFAYVTDEQAVDRVMRYDDEKKTWEMLNMDDKERLIPLNFNADDSAIVAKLSIDGGPFGLIDQVVSNGKRMQLASHPVGNINVVEWSARGLRPIAVATDVDVPEPRYLDPASDDARLHKDLSAQFPGSYVSFHSFSDDGKKLLFSVDSDRDPGNYYLFDRTTNKAEHLFSTMPWIDPARMGARKPIHFTASDGLELHGYLTVPPGRTGKNLPLILLPHGGPHHVSDTWFFDRDAQFLATRGYAVLQINFRGSGGRGDTFEAAGYRRWGDRMQDDLIEGVRWTIAQGIADPARICSYGASYGAYAAMMTAIRAPELFKCAVGYAGLYDLSQVYEEDSTRSSKSARNYWLRVIGDDADELKRWSPASQAGKLTVPVLLVHGSEDETTPLIQATTMRSALEKAGKPFEWMLVEGEGHGFYAEKNRIAFYERLEAFLAKHLGVKPEGK